MNTNPNPIIIDEVILLAQETDQERDARINKNVAALNELASTWSPAKKSAVDSLTAVMSCGWVEADQFLSDYSEFEIAIAPVAAWNLRYQTYLSASEGIVFTTPADDIFDNAFQAEMFRDCCMNLYFYAAHDPISESLATPNYSAAIQQGHEQSTLALQSRNLMYKLMQSTGFIKNIQHRLVLRANELNNLLTISDTNYREMYREDVVDAVYKFDRSNKDYELTAEKLRAEFIARKEGPQTVNAAELNFISPETMAQFNPSKSSMMMMAAAVPVVGTLYLAYHLVKSNAESLKRMGHGLSEAIRSGITFMSTPSRKSKSSANVSYHQVSLDDKQDVRRAPR